MIVQRERCRAAAAQGYSTATDPADYPGSKGLPFRGVHRAVGAAVAHAAEQGRDLAELSLDTLRGFSPLIGGDVYAVISLEGSLAARRTYGGTAPEQVRAAIARARTKPR